MAAGGLCNSPNIVHVKAECDVVDSANPQAGGTRLRSSARANPLEAIKKAIEKHASVTNTAEEDIRVSDEVI